MAKNWKSISARTSLPREMKDQIIALLDDWKAKQPPELAKPQKKTEKAL